MAPLFLLRTATLCCREGVCVGQWVRQSFGTSIGHLLFFLDSTYWASTVLLLLSTSNKDVESSVEYYSSLSHIHKLQRRRGIREATGINGVSDEKKAEICGDAHLVRAAKWSLTAIGQVDEIAYLSISTRMTASFFILVATKQFNSESF